MIAIIDYGMGNLRSVQKSLEKAGFAAVVTSDPGEVMAAGGVILPGVGAFRDAMDNLQRAGMIPAIMEAIRGNRPFLGICLGMQLLFETSEEDGYHRGLGVFAGEVKRLPAGLKVPHMGWNQLEQRCRCPILEGIPEGSAFYFVHSYIVVPRSEDLITATTSYGITCPAVVGRGRVFGVQFHPEKSSSMGQEILRNFGRLVREYDGHPGH